MTLLFESLKIILYEKTKILYKTLFLNQLYVFKGLTVTIATASALLVTLSQTTNYYQI